MLHHRSEDRYKILYFEFKIIVEFNKLHGIFLKYPSPTPRAYQIPTTFMTSNLQPFGTTKHACMFCITIINVSFIDTFYSVLPRTNFTSKCWVTVTGRRKTFWINNNIQQVKSKCEIHKCRWNSLSQLRWHFVLFYLTRNADEIIRNHFVKKTSIIIK